MSNDKATAMPLVEHLRSVPLDAVLRIDTPNALGCMDTRSITVGRLCHEAADALRHPATAGAPGSTDAERAAWLADKIGALGDYAKEAAAMLYRWPVAPKEPQ
jgi:hypothetical protein